MGRNREYHLRRQDEIPAVVAVDALAEIGPGVIPAVIEYFQGQEFLDYADGNENPPNRLVSLVSVGSRAGKEQVVALLVNVAIDPATAAWDRDRVINCLKDLAYAHIFGKKPVPEDSPEKLTPDLAAALQHSNWYVRAAAAAAVSRTDSGAAAVPYLTMALQDTDWRVRSIAAVSFGLMSMHNLQEIPSDQQTAFLASARQDADWRVRQSSVEAISEAGPVSMLSPLLQDSNEAVRLAAAMKFGGTEEPAQTIKLHALQHHQDARIRLAALQALDSDEPSPAAKSALIKALQDYNAALREAAASALDKAGDIAVPPLIKTLRDKNPRVRLAAVRSLGRIGSPAALSAIAATLDDPEANVRDTAKYALGDAAAAVMQETVSQLNHPDWQVRRQAAARLKVLGFEPDTKHPTPGGTTSAGFARPQT